MLVVFHGQTARTFFDGVPELLGEPFEVVALPDALTSKADAATFQSADVIVCPRLTESSPRPQKVRLFQCPGAGYDAVDLDRLPARAIVSNCFGHEDAIAEYIMATLLMSHLPIGDADRALRRGEWFPYWSGNPNGMHAEISGLSIGFLGFGHIAKAVVDRARAFKMTINVANRTRPPSLDGIHGFWHLDNIDEFLASSDVIVVSLALTPETKGIVDANCFSAMRSSAWLINVARGPVVDESALFAALRDKRIGGAVIDTWYSYPESPATVAAPSRYPFHELTNVVMTPHMSGWTTGTIERRKRFIAENIRRLHRGEPLLNVVRPDLTLRNLGERDRQLLQQKG